MTLKLVYAPHPIFKQKAEPIDKVDETVHQWIKEMFDVLYQNRAVGLGANMVGLLKRLIVVDLQEGGVKNPYAFVNPVITWASAEQQTFKEASLSFPGIAANITRPKIIKVDYLNEQGISKQLTAEGFFSTVIQHEIDYLEGKVFLDYLPRLKQQILLRKMKKIK